MSTYQDIFDAATNGTVEDVKFFVEQKGVNVNAKNNMDYTLLECVFVLGKENAEIAEIIKYLVFKGANIEPHLIFNAIDMKKNSDSIEITKLFIEKGISVNHRDSGMFPLLLAAGANNVEVAEFLISKGADIKMASSTTGQTPLQLAISKGNTEMVNFLNQQKRKLSPMKIVKIILIVAGIIIFFLYLKGLI